MGALREIVANFAVHVDDKPLTRLDRRINNTIAHWKKMGAIAATAMATAGFAAYSFVEAASKVEENLNLLKVTFEDNSDAVIKWSKTFGAAVGRSEFSLQESVARIGVTLKTMTKGLDAPVDVMAKKLSERVVDIASLRNMSEAEVMMRIESSLAGETEAARRLGVDITDKTLQEEAKKAGFGSVYKNLANNQKVLLRFKKIVEDTTIAENDAAKTAGSWANMSRKAADGIKDLAVRLGQQLMPEAKRVLQWTIDTVKWFQDLEVSLVSIFEASVMTGFLIMATRIKRISDELRVLVGILQVWMQADRALFIQQMRHLTAVTAKYMRIGVAAGGLFLIVEDLVAGTKGYDSVLGRALAKMWEMKSPAAAIARLWSQISVYVQNARDWLDFDISPAEVVDRSLRRQDAHDQQYRSGNVARRLNPVLDEMIKTGTLTKENLYSDKVMGLAPGLQKSEIQQLAIQRSALSIAAGNRAPNATDYAIGIVPQDVVGTALSGPAALNDKGLAALAAAQGRMDVQINVAVAPGTDPKAVGDEVKKAAPAIADEVQRKKAAAAARGR